MNIGAPELLIIAMGVGFIALTIVGVVKAAQNHDTPWLLGIIVAWLIGMGWLVALAYLVFGANRPTAVAVPTAPSGWLADPAGRHELRYWDGRVWTATVSDQGVTSTDPL